VFRYGSVCGEIRIGQVLLEQTAIHFLGESVVARQPRQVPSSPSNLSRRFAAFCGGSPPGSVCRSRRPDPRSRGPDSPDSYQVTVRRHEMPLKRPNSRHV
jgi:hypothetical protein